MSRYPDAIWKDVGAGSGAYKGGPLKIVHHTTESGTSDSAFAAYRSTGCFPQFTAAPEAVYQHLDTMTAGSALRNVSGGVETNRDGAIQIEVVGYAGSQKNPTTLERVADLCRWLEETHLIPPIWPNGPPKYGSSDPGGHNRNASNWNHQAGHYGHSQVPENTHWDPSYWPEELDLVMGGHAMHLEINGVNQDQAVESWLKKGRSYMSVADYSRFAGYPGALWNPDTETVSMSTQKVRCQLTEAGGAACPHNSVVLYPVPVAGLALFTPTWICQAHLTALTGTPPPAADPNLPQPTCPGGTAPPTPPAAPARRTRSGG
jgi:hypothetical protein